MDLYGRSNRWDIRAPNALTTQRQPVGAQDFYRLIRSLELRRPSQTSLSRRYQVEYRRVVIEARPGEHVVLRGDPRRYAFYAWADDLGTYHFSPYAFDSFGTSPFVASSGNVLRITEENFPGLPRLEWKVYLINLGTFVFHVIEVIDTAV